MAALIILLAIATPRTARAPMATFPHLYDCLRQRIKKDIPEYVPISSVEDSPRHPLANPQYKAPPLFPVPRTF